MLRKRFPFWGSDKRSSPYLASTILQTEMGLFRSLRVASLWIPHTGISTTQPQPPSRPKIFGARGQKGRTGECQVFCVSDQASLLSLLASPDQEIGYAGRQGP